jgi:hypothetical protein
VHEIGTRFRESRERMRAGREAAAAPSLDLETLGIDRPFTDDDLIAIDRVLALDTESSAVLSGGASRSWSGTELHTWRAQTGLDQADGNGSSGSSTSPATVGR